MNARNEAIINDNLEYATGLYDLYQSENDVMNALYLKGYNEYIVVQILARIKETAYRRRLAQAKKHIIYGLGLFVILYIVKKLFSLLPVTGEMTDGRDGGGEMLVWTFKFYREVFYFFMFLSLLRGAIGITKWFRLKRKGSI